jgi:single-strand DNA-binding protein
MPNLNRVLLIGNLTRDPELRVLPKGTSIAAFGLAINREWKDEAGQKKEEVTFIDCEAWGKPAEIIAKYCAKGRPLFVEGRLKLDSWEDKQSGQKRTKLKVVVENFQLLGSRDGNAPAAERQPGEDASEASAPATRAPRPAPAPQDSINDEDVPF